MAAAPADEGVDRLDPRRRRLGSDLAAVKVLGMRSRIAAITGLTLVLGFAVASLTGSRPLGGVVLVLGGIVCASLMGRARRGGARRS